MYAQLDHLSIKQLQVQSGPQSSSDYLCLFVALPEPGDDREAFATRNGEDFVKGVGGECD